MATTVPLACGDDTASGPASGGAAGSAGTGGFSAGGGKDGGADAAVESGTGGSSDAGGPDGYVPEPLPAHIDFQAVNPVPAGEQLLFNDWNASPNSVWSVRPDGSAETEIFRAYRVWSLGAAKAGDPIAFACADKEQNAHYGLSLGDAIQNTWLYDVGTQTAKILSWGNQNDECHRFDESGQNLYLCRRYDFQVLPGPTFTNKGYRLGRIAVASGSFEWLTPEPVSQLELHPTPDSTGSELYYTLVTISGGKQSRKIVKRTLPGGAVVDVIDNATLAALSPDGQRVLFADHAAKGNLVSALLDGSNRVAVANRPGTNATYSPDGSQVAFLWGETQTCHHIERVLADGSQADAPVRVRDCKTAFITDLAWIDKASP